MAIYTTFFLARPEELVSGFPGWKPPLPAPVRREFRNPFTKAIVTVESREPEWPDDEESLLPEYHAVAIQGRYEDYLEDRLTPFVQQQPHWAAKGLTDIELKPLLRIIDITTELTSPIHAPPSSGAMLRQFPDDFVLELSKSDHSAVAQQWAAEMSTPEYTYSVAGNKLYDGWTTEQAAQNLDPLVALAQKANPGHRLYLLIET